MDHFTIEYIESAIMRWVVLWDTACNFNAVISNQSIFNCLITSASTLVHGVQKIDQIESAQKIHASRGWCEMHAHQFWWAWPFGFWRFCFSE